MTGCPMDRRRFVGRLAGGVTAVSLLGTTGCATVRYARAETRADEVVIPLSEFRDDSVLLVRNPRDEFPILLHRADEARITAVRTRCMHRGCQAEPQGARIVCPCHGSQYALDGALLEGPADRPLLRFPVRIDAGRVRIDLTATPRRE